MTNAIMTLRPPRYASHPAHARLRMCQRIWDDLDDTYLAAVLRAGVLFDWIPGMDPTTPDPLFSGLPTYTSVDLHQHLALCPEIKKVMDIGELKCVQPEDVKCVSGMINVPKKRDTKNPQESWGPCTNLRNVNAFIRTTFFRLPTLLELALLLYFGAWACKVDLKSAYFRCPIYSSDRAWLTLKHQGECNQWQAFPFGRPANGSA